MKIFLCILQAFLFVVSHFSVLDSNFKEWMDEGAMMMTSKSDFAFESVTAEEVAVSAEEQAQCKAWFEENILYAGQNGKAPAYDFTVGGKSLRSHLDEWQFTVGEAQEVRGGVMYPITVQSGDLTATVEATLFEEHASCMWYVRVQNTGTEKSPVLRRFHAADVTLPTGKTTLYVSKGSSSDADDFELQKTACNFLPMLFNANGGRSASFLPYFNLCGKTGVVLGVGWTGQWYTSIVQRTNGVHIVAKQEKFSAYLLPGETVRSPLISLSFYKGKAVKGFNTFRNWETDCLQNENAREITTTGLASEFSEDTAEQLIAGIRAMPQEMCDRTDLLWMDAGWYTKKTSWYDGVGTWRPDPKRFPDGLAPIADAAAERGMGLLLWYEPERCCVDTEVYNEATKHDGWLVRGGENSNMLNLANDDACDYIANLIAESLRENHISLYRQDFNFTVTPLWKEQDEAMGRNRTGITENHYVTNEYRYLDRLIEINPGLMIDNCASGGRRLDIEMTRRSVPLWRTDYNCRDAEGRLPADIIEATQSASYGISCWLPLTGTAGYTESEYTFRSSIIPCSQVPGNEKARAFLTQNYYPLTYGGLKLDKFQAMQFGTEDSGVAMIYKRAEVRADSYTLRLMGLTAATTYEVYSEDAPQTVYTMTGAELMQKGLSISMADAPQAAVIFYNAK